MTLPVFRHQDEKAGKRPFFLLRGEAKPKRWGMKAGSILKGIAAIAVYLSLTGTAQAATYYVRTDGGTNVQCNGTADAPYPGSGSGQACAYNHPFWVLSVAGAPNKMVGGDTLIIGPGEYQMGLGAPNTPSCSQYYPWDCFMRAVPSGTAASPTRILGKGWDTGCTVKPQLWGTERSVSVLSLQSSSNVEIQCLDITDHSSCIDSGPDQATKCNRNTYPYGPWALNGIVASDSQNVLIKNVKIHGLRAGIIAGRLQDWTMENTDIIANSFVGWDGDIGASTSSNSGRIVFKNSRIMWSGCGENYPGLTPHHCYSQDQGGYGDGIGTNKTGGDWVFDHADISYNVSDGLDLLYHNGNGSITISHSRFEGNAGNQVKVAANTVIHNSKLIGDCAFFKDKSFTSTTDVSFNSVAFNHCRAAGSTAAMAFNPGMQVQIYNSTVTGNGDVMMLSSGASCVGTEKVISKNNIYIGGIEFNDGTDRADLYYSSGATGNSDGPCGNVLFSTDNDIIWGTKYNTVECNGNTSKCVDPKVVGPITFNGADQNVSIQSTSPAINVGSILSNVPSVDFNNYARGSSWDIGALEYGSVPMSTPPPPPDPEPDPGPIPTPVPTCGNGLIDTGEQCDGANLNGQTCLLQGFASGLLSCTSNCLLSTLGCISLEPTPVPVPTVPVCGNGIVEGTEQCDGADLNGQTCVSKGYVKGTLSCSSTCKYVTTKCSMCGNGKIDPGEWCDGKNLNGQSCTTRGYTGGTLLCYECTFNTFHCNQCGNGIVEKGEQCDGSNLNKKSCLSLGYARGTLSCDACKFVTTSCVAKR
jgi:hypothetical protein